MRHHKIFRGHSLLNPRSSVLFRRFSAFYWFFLSPFCQENGICAILSVIMELEKINLLEQKISRLLESYSSLKEEKSCLEQKAGQLEKELREEREKGELLREKIQAAEILEGENKRLREDREAARQKLEGILEKLERTDFN